MNEWGRTEAEEEGGPRLPLPELEERALVISTRRTARPLGTDSAIKPVYTLEHRRVCTRAEGPAVSDILDIAFASAGGLEYQLSMAERLGYLEGEAKLTAR